MLTGDVVISTGSTFLLRVNSGQRQRRYETIGKGEIAIVVSYVSDNNELEGHRWTLLVNDKLYEHYEQFKLLAHRCWSTVWYSDTP